MALLLHSPPSKVYFNGWESDTVRLGQHGWDISVSEDFAEHRFNMLLYHVSSNIKMLAEARIDPLRERASRGWAYSEKLGFDGPQFQVRRAWQGEARITPFHVFPRFDHWVDTRPQMEEVVPQDVMDLPIFRSRLAPVAKQLIVEPQDVSQLLEQIMRMQSPRQAEIRKNNARAVPVSHATILTFPAAA